MGVGEMVPILYLLPQFYDVRTYRELIHGYSS